MKTTNSVYKNTSARLRGLYCLVVVFCIVGCCEKSQLLNKFSRLEKEALKYGTVSVGAVRVTDYDDEHLKDSRKQLETALMNIRKELGSGEYRQPKPRSLDLAAGGLQQSASANEEPNKAIKGQGPQLSEIELIGMRMAALKFVESELEDLRLGCISKTEPNFHRVVVSLDCSAWVRGKAGAALVYIDLYPYKVDRWCHEASQILKEWREEEENDYQDRWNKIIQEELIGEEKDNAFEPLDPNTIKMPDKRDIDKERDPNDWVAFCHRWLEKKKLFPHIVHVERMGKAEYMIMAESDQSLSKFEIGASYPPVASGKVSSETGRKAARQMTDVEQLSLAFVAGDRRAGWLFMPSKAGAGTMPPTERRLRIVVDAPCKLRKLGIHVHKLFLGPDLEILDGADFTKQVINLDKTRKILTEADKLYDKKYPGQYRLIKTRMRNLLFQGWAEEIPVDVPKK